MNSHRFKINNVLGHELVKPHAKYRLTYLVCCSQELGAGGPPVQYLPVSRRGVEDVL